MKNIILLLILALTSLSSCVEIVEDEILPYEEKLVVHAFWDSDLPSNRYLIKITRTLPVLEEYSERKAEVADAEVFVESDGIRYQCLYQKGASYKDSYYVFNEDVQPEKTYKLSVRWHGKEANSVMRLPQRPEVEKAELDTINISYDGYRSLAVVGKVLVKPRANEAYTMTYHLYDTLSRQILYSRSDFYELKRFNETNTSGLVQLNVSYTIPADSEDLLSELGKRYKLVIHVHAFDNYFYDYFVTRYNVYTDATFSEPSKVKWNVTGNAIGIFSGYSTTSVDTIRWH